MKFETGNPSVNVSLAFNDLTQGEINEYFKGYLWFDLMVETFGFFDGALASTGLSVLKWNMLPQHRYFYTDVYQCKILPSAFSD